MPVGADKERELLNRYHLTTLYPSEWPHTADDDDVSDSDEDLNALGQQQTKSSANSRRSLSSTYKNIDRHASIRSGISGTQKTANGEDSLVQKDEADPLGMAPSVAAELRRRGLPVEDNVKLRNRFMLSSTSFSPQMFLSQVHQDASTEDLLQGLDFLSRSIEQKSASLKVLVESNFEKFVRAKATIDNVYTEMRTQGADPHEEQLRDASNGRTRPHSRQTSKNQSHFRNSSNPFSPANKPLPSDKKKNALTKESEYGVQGIKAPLLEVAVKAEEVWGPALGGREREEGLKSVLGSMDQHREVFKLSGSVYDAIRRNDYDTVISDFKKARKYADEARNIAEIARTNEATPGEADINQIILTARMWHDVSAQVESFKQDVWRRLRTSHGHKPAAVADATDKELHTELMSILLQLGVDENPIWQWLNSRSLYLKDRIARSFERSRIEIEILRRRLANNDKPDTKNLAKYLRAADPGSQRPGKETLREVDTPNVLDFLEKVQASVTALLSTSDGILGEVIEFWETTQSFIDNKAQKAFPIAVFAAGLEHLELEPDDVANLRSGAQELISLIRESVFAFFSDAPVEDLSELYSPIPPTPVTPDSANVALSPSIKRTFSFDPKNVPPPSPRNGEAWEKFAFWPPGGNSLSGAQYLGRVLVLVGTAASEMASLSVVRSQRGAIESLKTLVGAVRERCVQALCAAWVPDAERCKFMERWQRHPERRDLTTMPASFMAFEEKVLAGMQKIAYVSDANTATSTNARGEDVLVPPSAKLLQMVRGCFVTSLYKALSGMVENAERPNIEGAKGDDPDGVTLPLRAIGGSDAESVAMDARNQNVRRLITLSNLSHLRSETIPQLISQFESSFSVKLTDESKTIRDVLSQIDARLFQAYVKPTVEVLQTTITTGITSSTWAPASGRPTDARPYVYEVLLTLVLVHSEVSTTAATLTNQILSYLLEQSSLSLIAAFKSRPRYTLPALMQATLDVEFMAQTLNNYTTDRASEVQSQVYLTLDERTDNDARARLEGELPEMRAVLKRLREGTKGEFGCFRREKRGRERVGSGGGRA